VSKPELSISQKEDFIRLIAQHTGLKTREQDQDAFTEKILLRMKDLKLTSAADYYQLLANNSLASEQEWDKLFFLLTNTESYFFRDQGQFDLLRNHVVPEIIERQKPTKTIRICSAGCSTGEEPYSLAILLKELIGEIAQWNINIFGIDINQEALKKAKTGIYSAWSFRSVNEAIQRRYFRAINNQYHLLPEIKQMVKFHQVNLFKDALPQPNLDLINFDLIICRNVFIYFEAKAVGNVINKFYQSLQPLGYLLTGHAELYGQNLSKYQVKIFPDSIIYQRKSNNLEEIDSQLDLLVQRQPISLQTLPQQPSLKQSFNSQGIVKYNHKKILTEKQSKPPRINQKIVKESQTDETVEKLAQEAEKLVQQKAYDLAINKLEQLLKQQPRNFQAYRLMCQIYANRGKYEEACQYCKQALAIDSLAVTPHYLLAQMAEEQGNIDQAKQAFKRIIYLDPNSLAAYFALSNIYQQEGDEKRSKKMLETAINLLKTLPPNTKIPERGNITASELINQLTI